MEPAKRSLLYIVLFSALFISCATTNTPGTSSYTVIPDTRIYSNKYPFSNTGNIIIKRDSGFMGSALDATLYINDEKFLKMSPGNYFQFDLPIGIYFLSLESAKGVNLGTPFYRTLKIEISDKIKRFTFRVFPMPTQGIMIEEVFQ